MGRVEYILRRLVLCILVLIGVSIVTFIIGRLIPSDPAQLWVGPRAKPEQVAEVRAELGLDQPLYLQYFQYIKQIAQGNFGISIKTHHPIIDDLRVFLPATLELVIFSMILTVVVGIPIGVLASARKNGLIDHLSRVLAVTSVSLPVFWLGIILQLIFVNQLHLLPLGGRVSRDVTLFSPIQTITGFDLIDTVLTSNWIAFRDVILHIILPSITLSAYGIGLGIRMTRANMIEILEQKFIVAAWAAGLRPHTIYFRLALKNALVPTLMVFGLTFVWQLTGAILVEIIFQWPGIGTYLTNAILNIDFPVVVSVTLVVAFFYVMINLILDVLQAAIDPRVSLE
jgi:peptide/nickel transport system permease protein